MGGFRRYIDRFRRKAQRLGISVSTFEAAFRDVAYNERVVALDRHQPETARRIWEYLDLTVTPKQVNTGREKLAQTIGITQEIQDRFSVEREILIAIWGLETAYGSVFGDFPVFEALATLSYDGRRRLLFEKQLVAALHLTQSGCINATETRGSWAGALGHTQLMPSNIRSFGIDFDDDAKINVLADDPTDAFATSAHMLAVSGWQLGVPVALLASLDPDFDFNLSGFHAQKLLQEWSKFGVSPTENSELEDRGLWSVFVPAGKDGPAFLVSENFSVLLCYNNSAAYALSVAMLADQLRGNAYDQLEWPRHEPSLTRAQIAELQHALTSRGFDTVGADGIIGPNTVEALRRWQKSMAQTPDGFPRFHYLGALKRA